MANAIEEFKKAIISRNYKMIGRASDALRGAGFNYKRQYQLATQANPNLTESDFEEIMAEVDDLESGE